MASIVIGSAPAEGRRRSVSRLADTAAWSFWFAQQAKLFLAYLLFSDNPAAATLAGGVVSLGFASGVFVLTLVRGSTGTKISWPASARWILYFVLWSGTTLLWTQAASRMVALAYWALMALDLVVVFTLFRLAYPPRVAERSCQGFVWGSVAIASVAVLGGARLQDRPGLGAELLHPNFIGNQFALGALLAFCLAVHAWNRHRRRGEGWKWLALALLLLMALAGTLSKTAIAGFVLAFGVLVLRGRVGLRGGILLTVGVSLVFLLSFDAIRSNIDEYLQVEQAPDADFTFTGRIPLWVQTLEMIHERPLMGHGFLSFRDRGPQLFSFRVTTAHNEWIHLWFSLGIVGVLLAAVIYGTLIVHLRRTARVPALSVPASAGTALLTYFLARGLMEASLTNLVFPLTLLVVILGWTASPTRAPASWSQTISNRSRQ